MPKERLDLMIESDVKSMLKIAALAQGVSMSQLVEDVLVDHLNAAGDPQSPSGAVADMLYIQQLQERLTAAIEAGLVMPLEAYDELCLHGDLSLVTAVPVIYLRDGDRPNQTDVILDNCVDADGNDVLTTYNDVTSTVTVRLHWNVSARGELEPDGLWVWPKGRTSGLAPAFKWHCPKRWKGPSEALRALW